MVVVSPWTRGGWVNSQLFDHTSLIRFLEARFAGGRPDLIESNITPWRRAVAGDLTTAFDFRAGSQPRPVTLPDTDDFKPRNLVRRPDQVPVAPADQHLPRQERGVRSARALPYTLHADAEVTDGTLNLTLRNTGHATAVFQVRSTATDEQPRSYTVEPHKTLVDTWSATNGYDVAVYGPNGFHRSFRGGSHPSPLRIRCEYGARADTVALTISNDGPHRVTLTVRDGYTSRRTTVSVRGGQALTRSWSVSRTRGWYDLLVSTTHDATVRQRYAGHLENGRDSISDPAMGGLL